MLDWFKKLMPKEEKFFDLFEAHAAKAREAARSLRLIVDGGKETAAHCATLSRQEEEADAISYEVMQAIRRSFITPFDRSDIKALSAALDDAIDQMNKTGETVMLYDVESFEPNMRAMADKVIAMADLIAEGLPLMRNVGTHSAKLHALTGELTRLEGESDQLNGDGLRALYKGPAQKNAMAFVIGSELYEHLEKVCDRFEDVAHVMSDIVIEHIRRRKLNHMDMGVSISLVLLIAVALAFDFMNGLHDAANSIATIVSTRVLKPQYAVVWAAFFNFAAYFVFGVHVANTVGKGIVDPNLIDDSLIFGALMGAIAWNAITWWGGIPSSSSHALIGGIVGAGVAKAGFSSVIWSGLSKTIYAIVLSPFTDFILALLMVLLVSWLFVRANPAFADGVFRKMQLVSAALYSLGHGSNDAQKTAGIIAVLLYSHGVYSEFTVPGWVILSCYAVMGLGTLMGGWRIVHTMGSKITRLTPMQGSCAETAGALTLFGATYLGIPVSTTHTITSAIVGVGSARRVSAVRWNVATGIVYAWIITMPAAAALAAMFYWLAYLIIG